MDSQFQLLLKDSGTSARRGVLRTPHGEVQTPIFMPVGTQATVKALTPAQVCDVGAQIILGNTYHLNIRPGPELIHKMGGLHKFMSWDKPILTDSGGFQVFSLAKLRKMDDRGVVFKSHLDGREIFLGPEEAMRIQDQLGSDIAMVLDECPPWPCTREQAEVAVERSVLWAGRCREEAERLGIFESGRQVFAIVQGSNHEDLRADCAKALAELAFPGYAIGGVSVGEPEPEMLVAVKSAAEHLPEEKPRYVMGVGTPPQLLRMINLGADMFDCVMPTREARHGSAFTPFGRINLKNSRFREDPRPLVEDLDNYTCRSFSRSYLRHLVLSQEILGCTLLSLHNVHFFLDLMRQAREHLDAGDFNSWSQSWIERYESGTES